MCAIQKKVFVDRRQTPFNQILRFAQNDIGGLRMTGAEFYLLCSIAAWAAARRAIGTRNGEQET